MSACSLFGEEALPEIKEVVIVGTEVPSDFSTTQRFFLRVIPIDENKEAYLSNELLPIVSLQNLASVTTSTVISEIIEPSGKPLAVALDIDASGSMSTTDRSNSRLKGAKAFVNVLSTNAPGFSATVYEYSGSSANKLQGFTNNVDSLNRAIDMIGSNGGTPTYISIQQILAVLENDKPADQFERAIVLLSDGQPNNSDLRSETCRKATEAKVPVFSIGLGPASDILTSGGGAIEEMRAIASCSGGTYAGIDPSNVDSSAVVIFNNIGLATALGSVTLTVQLGNVDTASLPTGTIVQGELVISNGKSDSLPASFTFRVP